MKRDTYDYEAGFKEYLSSLNPKRGGGAHWLVTKGPEAWGTSEMMHKAFDRLSGHLKKRKRTDQIQPSIIASIKLSLSSESIQSVCTMADRVVAHAERLDDKSGAAPRITYKDIDNALGQLIQVTNYLSGSFFYDTAIGSAVPTPQYNVLEGLDSPWTSPEMLPKLHRYWNEVCESLDKWLEKPLPI